MDAFVYGSLHGEDPGFWEKLQDELVWLPFVRHSMQHFHPGIFGEGALRDKDVARDLSRAYVELVKSGEFEPVTFKTMPKLPFLIGDGKTGAPTKQTQELVLRLHEMTGYPPEYALAWANSFYYWYKEGKVPFRVYDPTVSSRIKDNVGGIPVPDIKPMETANLLIKLGLVAGGLYLLTIVGPGVKALVPRNT